MTYQEREKLESEARRVVEGDTILVQGHKYKVAEIITNDLYIENDKVSYYLEFLDENGRYHYWKSLSDGGRIL